MGKYELVGARRVGQVLNCQCGTVAQLCSHCCDRVAGGERETSVVENREALIFNTSAKQRVFAKNIAVNLKKKKFHANNAV